MLTNWTQATTTTTGTGTVTLASVSGFPRPSDVLPTGAFVQYVINDANGSKEAGIGKLAASNTLERISVISTFASGTYNNITASALTLSTGTHEVLVTPIAEHLFKAPAFPFTNTVLSNRHAVSGYHTGGHANAAVVPSTSTPTGYPFLLHTGGLLTGFGVQVATGGAGSSLILGLYEMSDTGHPGRLLAKTSAAIDTTTSGFKTQTALANVRVSPGCYWLAACVPSGTVPVVTQTPICGTAAGVSGVAFVRQIRAVSASSDLPDPFPTSGLTAESGSPMSAPVFGLLLT